MLKALTAYVLAAMMGWSPGLKEEKLKPIAEDIATVALDESHPPAFDGKLARPKTALLAAGMAWFETGGSFAKWVDQGSCNDEAWRSKHVDLIANGDCDGGRSFSMWQIQPRFGEPSGKELVADRKLAIAVAIERMRSSIAAGRGLCDYTGERVLCKAAKARMAKAVGWWKSHPFEEGLLQ